MDGLENYLTKEQLETIFEDYARNLNSVGVKVTMEDFIHARQVFSFVFETHENIMKLLNGEGTLQGFHNGHMMVIPTQTPYSCSALTEAESIAEVRAKMDGIK